MIGRLKGTIIEKQPPQILVDVGGVGYEAQAPMTSFYPMPAVGEQVILHTHLSVSENAHQLFAFYTQDERKLFRTLIKVSGVGPKMALAILSGMPANEFVQCIIEGNSAALVRVPGVGKKTAERLIIEVKDRLKGWESLDSTQATFGSNLQASTQSAMTAVAESPLVALVLQPTAAASVVSRVQPCATSSISEDLIRFALASTARYT